MLTFELRVNGSLIAATNIVNVGAAPISRYEYQHVAFPIDGGKPVVREGSIEHRRKDGAEVLVRKIMEAMTGSADSGSEKRE